MTDQVAHTGGPTRSGSEPAEAGPPHLFGLPQAMALIVGSVIGVGIFNLPTSLAFYGPITLVSMALTTALFSYIGVETVSVAAAKVRNPDRNIPRATVLGTLAVAVVYMLSLTAVFGIVPTAKLASGSAPYSDAVNAMFGGTWAGNIMAIAVIISGFGALNGWIMISAEMPLAAAKDGLFPERFKRLSKNGVPAFGIVVSAVLSSAAVVVNYLGSNGATVFTTLILMTGITAAIPYAFSALAQIKWRLADRRQMHTPRFARDMIVAVLALVFSILFIWYSRNTGQSFWVYWAPFFLAAGALLLGIPVYLMGRRHMTQPEPVPPYR